MIKTAIKVISHWYFASEFALCVSALTLQISQHNCAGPFMEPVDVVGLGLHDYFKVP